MYSLPARKFFKFAHRISAYKGVMRALIEYEAEKEQRMEGVTQGDTTYRELPSDDSSLLASQFDGVFEVAKV